MLARFAGKVKIQHKSVVRAIGFKLFVHALVRHLHRRSRHLHAGKNGYQHDERHNIDSDIKLKLSDFERRLFLSRSFFSIAQRLYSR